MNEATLAMAALARPYLDSVSEAFKGSEEQEFAKKLSEKVEKWNNNLKQMNGSVSITFDKGCVIAVSIEGEYAKYKDTLEKNALALNQVFVENFINGHIGALQLTDIEKDYLSQRAAICLFQEGMTDVWEVVAKIPTTIVLYKTMAYQAELIKKQGDKQAQPSKIVVGEDGLLQIRS